MITAEDFRGNKIPSYYARYLQEYGIELNRVGFALNDSVSSGRISKDVGLSKTLRLELRQKQDTAEQRLNTEISLLWKRIEPQAIAFAHEASLENAERFYAAVYDLPNDWRHKRC